MARLFISFYMTLIVGVLAYQYVGEYGSQKYVQDWVALDKTNDYRGLFYLLDALHQRVDAQTFQRIVASYPETSNVPVEIGDINAFELTADQVSRLRGGRAYVEDAFDDVLYFKLSGADLIARFGPMHTYEPLMQAVAIYEKALFAVLAILVLLWTVGLQIKLKRLESAAMKLGEGTFAVRVSEKGRHAVGRLNKTFNLMARKIEKLVEGHKSLTNAVAHELRTPIARIRFQLDMLNGEEDAEERKELVYGISDDVNQLGELVEELLSYARFDREPASMEMSRHSLHESLMAAIKNCYFDNKVQLHYDPDWSRLSPDKDLLPFDPRHLERAVGNLITNAQKYATSQIQLHVAVSGDDCSIIVDDDGPGISDADRERVFEPFRRLDDSRTRATGGHGLGLAIVEKIAHWHEGEVRVERAPIGGARLIFSWPARRRAAGDRA
ncbi:Signal transduction histidine kinase [Hahella chejuensis KCTC 2396]|uniref:histidine kinase n=1 Tax=Hahella chejuensis (strain KCTC 2396) TaxID=349521 RepID=Q2SEU5_HAHCH|nr:ATP-binding protein [Hahella chejuensis]ABC30829.1 Signal transduction histidine kinase [Hahella chejuensis KCTC 2396]